MKTEHTKGEWHAKDGQIYPTETGKTLAVIPYFNKEDKEQAANQKLIAAAPDLLGALKMIIADIENGHIDAENGIVKGSYHFHIMQNAIQKATEQ